MNIKHEPQAAPPLPDEPFYRRGEQARRWGGLLLLVGVVWLVFELTTRGSLFGMGLGFVEHAQTLPVQRYNVERVLVSGVNDQVELVGVTGEEVVVEATRRGYGWNGAAAERALERLEVVVNQRGETLHVEVRRPPSFGTFLGRSPSAELRIGLPAEIAVEASLVNGDLSASELRGDLVLSIVSGEITTRDTAGALQASLTSGDLYVHDHRGSLSVESVSGDIEADGALAGARINTVSGDVQLSGASDELNLRSISGDLALDAATAVQLHLESTSGDIDVNAALLPGSTNRVHSISGELRLRLRDPHDLRLEATTASGEIASDLSFDQHSVERRRLAGTIGSGATQLNVGTTSGDIRVTSGR
jgi:hypothetical protein